MLAALFLDFRSSNFLWNQENPLKDRRIHSQAHNARSQKQSKANKVKRQAKWTAAPGNEQGVGRFLVTTASVERKQGCIRPLPPPLPPSVLCVRQLVTALCDPCCWGQRPHVHCGFLCFLPSPGSCGQKVCVYPERVDQGFPGSYN